MRAAARISIALSAISLVQGVAPAMAQSPGWAGLPMQSTVMRNLLNNATHGQAGPYSPGSRPTPGGGPPAYGRPPPPTLSSLPYREDPAIAARVVEAYLGDIRRQAGPAAADRIRQALSRTDFRTEWSRMVAADGLRRGDLVDAMAAYWVLNWMIVHHADNTRAQTLAARAQVARAVSGMPGLLRLDPAGRQTLAETLMLRQVLQAALYLNAVHTHDQASLQRLSADTEQSFRRDFGMDLAAYALTPQGFIAAGRAVGANEPKPAPPPLASTLEAPAIAS